MNFEQQINPLSGVVAVPTTPFRPDGGIDEEAYQRIIRRLVDGGITTVTPNGNTGEFYALSPAEAKVVTRLALEAVDPATTVLVGVGHDVASAREAARGAQSLGAAMVMVHQPVHPYVSLEGWIEYHRAIASAVPELGVVLYVRNEAIPGSAFARLGELCPNVVGVKYAVANPVHFAEVAADAGAGQVHLGGRCSGASRPRVLRPRRDRVHFGPRQRRPGDLSRLVARLMRRRSGARDTALASSAAL